MALRLLGSLARVTAGFVLACLVAGITLVLFVDTPIEIARLPGQEFGERAVGAAELALLTATQVAIFSAAFAAITLGLGEWLKIRSLPFYLAMGLGIAALGFMAQYQSETSGQATILNNYAIKAFLTAGLFSGLIYWLAAGQFAGAARMGGADGDRREKGEAAAGRPAGLRRALVRPAGTVRTGGAAPIKPRAFDSLAGRLSKIAFRDGARPAAAPATTQHEQTSVPTTRPAADRGAATKPMKPDEELDHGRRQSD